jgi:hypothetical protein
MMPPASGARLLAGFVLAPLAAPLAYAAVLLLIARLGPHASPSIARSLDLVLPVFALGTPLAYAAALLAGGPVYLLLRMLGLVHRWPLWIAGAGIGATVALAIAPHLRGDLFSIRFPWWVGALLGVVSAEAFLRLVTGASEPGLLDAN